MGVCTRIPNLHVDRLTANGHRKTHVFKAYKNCIVRLMFLRHTKMNRTLKAVVHHKNTDDHN